MVLRDGSVVMVAVRVMNQGQVVSGHAVYAFRNAFGQIRFMDRTVGQASSAGVRRAYKSLDEIAPVYGATSLLPYEAAVIQNVFVKTVAHETPRLLIPVLGVIATEDAR